LRFASAPAAAAVALRIRPKSARRRHAKPKRKSVSAKKPTSWTLRRDEAKQTLECKVRVQDGKPDEVTYINFIF
jgi:hypothetical protein